ncbi:lipopolysaccharide heptosyltransferase II [Chitiniphilus eburneus]|uniref:lipopolysaccharide heptosyltransferase II n=1 Tax=Chitiniphilus eburneus TaxID=2571148 RepID=A0A4U0Q462_9NEIS|nr:lipopolysaccharide heptosyltransferase II [Chitiniphilus eburneus]TJZ75500.1 lipopolysaccharide heptosyltransferase II [Chitiniphilus eburneus]
MKRILIVAPAWVGDAVMAQPLYQRLHDRYADNVVIDVLAPAWTRPLHARMAEIDEAIDAPFGHGQLALLARWKLGRQLARRKYDQAILLPNSLKSALVPYFAGIPVRTGWLGESRYGLLNDWRKLDKAALPRMVERFSALAERAGKPVVHPIPNPRLEVDDSACRAALAALGLDADRPILALCPGAEYGPAKRWPARHAAALARTMMALGAQVWLFGSTKDREICDEIVALAPGVVDLAGKTTLAQAIDLMSLASAVVCNDSGLMHVAAALGRPLVAVYGSSSPKFTPPLSHKARIVTLNVECSPCFQRTCPLGHMKCLNDLGPDQVESALRELVPALFEPPVIDIAPIPSA